MSTTAIVPPPNSSSLRRRVPRLTVQARALLTTMNIHFAGVAALVVLDLYLIAHLFLVWQGLKAHNAAAIDQERVQMLSAQLAAKPLRGLDTKLADSTKAADIFYQKRLPYEYSQVLAELGALTKNNGVRLTRVQYAQEPELTGTDALIQVRMDASVSGDYRPIVQFVNAAERDKMFFLITGMNLTGQQTGQVNLRLRLTTYLRAPGADEMTGTLPVPDAAATAATPAGGPQ
jgi:type IV pilus assembly protein PilO